MHPCLRAICDSVIRSKGLAPQKFVLNSEADIRLRMELPSHLYGPSCPARVGSVVLFGIPVEIDIRADRPYLIDAGGRIEYMIY